MNETKFKYVHADIYDGDLYDFLMQQRFYKQIKCHKNRFLALVNLSFNYIY